MPNYEYKCDSCGTVFEVRQKFADAALTVHDECGGAVHRLLSAPALMFKGSGWYVTDYGRGTNGSSASKAEAESKAKSESKTESKSDSKPESKPAATPTTSSSSTSDKK